MGCIGWSSRARAANRTWVKHTIDESFSQVHALKMADIDGDGEPELLAGKRYRGHNGRRSRIVRSAGDLLLQDRSQDRRVSRAIRSQ